MQSPQAQKQLEEDFARIGLQVPERLQEHSDFVVFFDAQLAVEIFLACQTQWQYSIEGVIGLNYSSVLDVIALYAQSTPEQLTLLHEIRAIEAGFLLGVREKREQKNL
jgi:hypothetical protein